MSPHEHDDLRRLLSDAVDDVEPRPGLDAIRSRTPRTKENLMTNTRTWLFGALGAAVAVAAVITGVALVGSPTPSGDDPGPATSGPASEPPSQTPEPTPEPSDTGGPAPEARALAVYYLGDTPVGPRLYREFHRVETADPMLSAVREAMGQALDPDYRTMWPDSVQVEAVRVDGDVIRVELSEAPARPAGMSEAEAAMSVEQVIYTAQAAAQTRAPVQFQVDGNPVAEVLGQPTSEPLANGPVLETLSHVSLTSPAEGDTASGTLEVSGVANSFEANVVLRLQRFEGTQVALEDFATAEGWMGEQLFPFETSIDLAGVQPGRYVLIAMTDDPSGGAEGPGAYSDSRTVVIE
jgi:hypothetical protein